MLSYFCFALVFVATCNARVTNEPPANRNAICTKRNGYYKMDSSCDAYVECNEFIASNKICPDGLYFNLNAKWPNYPCGYPSDVPCIGRGMAQSAIPTEECPHQYGFFPSLAAPAESCGQYRMCVAGKAFEMLCPTGLAFNPVTSQCDWPDLVASCNVEDFLRFTCPPVALDANGNPKRGVTNHKHETNCYHFFACDKGRARLLACDAGLAFDPVLGRCVDSDLVECSTATNMFGI